MLNGGTIQEPIGLGFGSPPFNVWYAMTNLLSFNGTKIMSEHGDIQHGSTPTNSQLTIILNNCDLFSGSWALEFTGVVGSSNTDVYISNTRIHENSWCTIPGTGIQNLRAIYATWCNLHAIGVTIIVSNTFSETPGSPFPVGFDIDPGVNAWIGNAVFDFSNAGTNYSYFVIATNGNFNTFYFGPTLNPYYCTGPANAPWGKAPVYVANSVNVFQPPSANLTNWSLLSTNAFPATASVQPANANLTNFASLDTNAFAPNNPAGIANAGGMTNAGIVVTVTNNQSTAYISAGWTYFVTNESPRMLYGQIFYASGISAIPPYSPAFTVSWPTSNAWSTNACIVVPSGNNCWTNSAFATAGWSRLCAYNMSSNSFQIGTGTSSTTTGITNVLTFSVLLP